jgi:MerR family transcriptional regulator, heat shock protein HspR
LGERALYTISIVADLIGVGQATLREWERQGLVRPSRRNGLRLYSDNDLRRLRFIFELLEKGLNIAGVSYLVGLYPCWFFDACPTCARKTERSDCARVCWKEVGTYCVTALDGVDLCQSCEHCSVTSAGKPGSDKVAAGAAGC